PQDLQLFAPGLNASIRPVRVEATFDGRPKSPAHSDHDRFRVGYEISWDVETPASSGCTAIRLRDVLLMVFDPLHSHSVIEPRPSSAAEPADDFRMLYKKGARPAFPRTSL